MMNEVTDTQPWYRQFWPWALISIPLATVIACSVTIVIAIQTNDGLVSDDYYREGLAINRGVKDEGSAESQ